MKNQIKDINLSPLSDEQLERASRKQLLALLRGEQKVRQIFQDVALEMVAREQEMRDKLVFVEGLYYKIRSLLFKPKSERGQSKRRGTSSRSPKDKGSVPRLPSERYPNAEIIEKHITAETMPTCGSCGNAMEDSGMTEESEYLTVIPKQYIVVQQHRHIYRCRCHGSLVTAPSVPRIVPGSSYSDEMAIDATLSKYCDLIPMERYSQMAKRQGFEGIPPQSLIGLSQKLGEFLKDVYKRLKRETLEAEILQADETPHRMLEGDEREGWYLWSFSSVTACFYECHPTRSGDVAGAVLNVSNCQVLLSDVYSGYKKAVRVANEKRVAENRVAIEVAYCNAHARRAFKGISEEDSPDATFMVKAYEEIYAIESEAKPKSMEERAIARQSMRAHFEVMKDHAYAKTDEYSNKSGIGRGFSYFLKNYTGLTRCLEDPRIPLDNNAAERSLRSPVVGRKTWYGTHSKAGAETAAIHFSLIESCKLNRINPRSYYHAQVERIHGGSEAMTPKEWAASLQPYSSPPL